MGGPFKEFEVTNIRHILHEKGKSDEIKYICRALSGNCVFVMVPFTWIKKGNKVVVSGCKKTNIESKLVWFEN